MSMTNRFENRQEAIDRAIELTLSTGNHHIAYEAGYVCSPWAVVEMPKIGDEVSMGFNGDSYTCGTITKITKTYRITTSQGVKFSRVGDFNWKQGGKSGTFSMIKGHVEKRNPHF